MLKTPPNCVLVAHVSSTYRWERDGLGRLRVGRVNWWYACGLASGMSVSRHAWGRRVRYRRFEPPQVNC